MSRREARPGGRAVAPDTIFELGSITKVFTGILLASCARDGTVALDRDTLVEVVVLLNRARSVDRLGLRLVERLGQ